MTERDVGRARTLSYMPALDGLRAVAVLAVLLYHGGVSLAPGGFLGVDLFFVLSGYLITSLLILEHERSGTLDLGAFWLRRARRLLPALCVTFILTGLYARAMADPETLVSLRYDNVATLFYVSNWWFIARGQSYFEQFAAPSVLRHTWSLGIEEQWYILWPLLLVPALRQWGRRSGYLAAFAASGALCSALLMAVLFDPMRDPSRVYYGTDTRAQALLFGAALAFLLYRCAAPAALRHGLNWLGVVGAATVFVFFIHVRDTDGWMYRGGYALMAGAATVLVAACVQPRPNLLARALSLPPLVWIGRISYGLYLYHWPIFVALNDFRTGLRGVALLSVRLAVTFAVATVSYTFIEMPVRRGILRSNRRLREAGAIAAMAVVALGAALLMIPAQVDGARTAPADLSAQAGRLRVLIIGDSVVTSLGEPFDPAKHPGLWVETRGYKGCGIMHGQVQRPVKPPDPESCPSWEKTWTTEIEEIRPDVSLVLIGSWESWDRWVNGELLRFGTPEFVRYFNKELDSAIRILTSGGGKVILLTPPCYRDPHMAEHPWLGPYAPADRHNEIVALLEVYARRQQDVSLIDLASFVCPGGVYQEALNGVPLQSDGSHFTKEAAAVVWDWLAPRLLEVVRRNQQDGAWADIGGNPERAN